MGGFFIGYDEKPMQGSSFSYHFPMLCDKVSIMIDHADFSVVVKNRAAAPKSWKWEIYRAGRTSPIERSEACFETMTEANRAGKVALRLFLSEYPEYPA